MTFQQLSYVVEVGRCGSINRAARNLFLSQSGISTAIRDLEEELGIQFFNRSNRGVEFTPEGEEFLAHAEALLEQKRRIEELYSGGRSAPAAVRFSVSTQRYPFAEDAFVRLLRKTAASNYQFSIREAGMDTVIQDVCEHRADIGVLFLSDLTEKTVRRRLDDRNVEFHQVAAAPPCVYIRRDHPLAGCDILTETKLAEYPYVLFEREQGAAAECGEECRPLPEHRPARTVCVNSLAAMRGVLASTDAYAAGCGLLTEGLSDERVLSIPLKGRGSIRLGWIHGKNDKLSPPAREFAALLEQAAADAAAYTRERQDQRSVLRG